MKLLIAIATFLPIVSSQTVLETNPQECIDPDSYPEDTDFFPEKFVPHDTTDLVTVTYHKSYKIVTNKFLNKSYLLYQCGTEPPADEVASGNHHLVLPVPHTGGVAITETPQIPPIELLGKRSEISAYIGNPKLVSSPCLSHLMNEGTVETIYFPEDAFNNTLIDQGTADYLDKWPDAIIFAGMFGNLDADRHMGIAGTQEKTAVATFDWLGMYSALFNLEGMANKIIAETESRYQCSADNAAALTADVEQVAKPKILWAQYFSGEGGWSVVSCPTWDTAYYCEYAQHCGAELISRPEGMGFNKTYGSPTVYWYLTDDEFLEVGKDVETWIYPSKTFEDVYYSKKEMLDQFKSVQNKNVYDTQGQGPHGWHEQRLAEYDVVALDMCTLVGTNNPDSIHRRKWFRNYFDEPIGNAGTCNVPDEIDEAYIPSQAECTPLEAETPVEAEPPVNADVVEAEPPVEVDPPVEPEPSPAVMYGKGFIVTLVVGIMATIVV